MQSRRALIHYCESTTRKTRRGGERESAEITMKVCTAKKNFLGDFSDETYSGYNKLIDQSESRSEAGVLSCKTSRGTLLLLSLVSSRSLFAFLTLRIRLVLLGTRLFISRENVKFIYIPRFYVYTFFYYSHQYFKFY